ncbi:hypothetical protein D3C86_1993400 [compost metagenome]
MVLYVYEIETRRKQINCPGLLNVTHPLLERGAEVKPFDLRVHGIFKELGQCVPLVV